jgi:hypothetical protein
VSDPLDHECPSCKVAPGEPCIGVFRVDGSPGLHWSRGRLAGMTPDEVLEWAAPRLPIEFRPLGDDKALLRSIANAALDLLERAADGRAGVLRHVATLRALTRRIS